MKFNQVRPIILASSSPRRKEYLERFQIDFKIISADIDENSHLNEKPLDYVKRMAREKIEAVKGKSDQPEIIIAADTIVVLENKILGKPLDYQEALQMLNILNDQTHQVITAFVILDTQTGFVTEDYEITDVLFYKVSSDALEAYVSSGDPFDKAGGYSIQGLGTFLVKSIKGSFNNVVGLPIEKILKILVKQQILFFSQEI